jgi:hypothetical protein
VSPAEAHLVPPEDPPALARAIRDSFDDPVSARARATRARARLRTQYAAGPWLDRYDRLYTALAAARLSRNAGHGAA